MNVPSDSLTCYSESQYFLSESFMTDTNRQHVPLGSKKLKDNVNDIASEKYNYNDKKERWFILSFKNIKLYITHRKFNLPVGKLLKSSLDKNQYEYSRLRSELSWVWQWPLASNRVGRTKFLKVSFMPRHGKSHLSFVLVVKLCYCSVLYSLSLNAYSSFFSFSNAEFWQHLIF